MTRKPRTTKSILSRSRATFRSQPIAADGKSTLLAESLGERNIIHCLKFLHDIRNITSQKKTFTVLYGGAEHSYTPDICAEYHLTVDNHAPVKLVIEEKSRHWFEKMRNAEEVMEAHRIAVEAEGHRFIRVFRDEIEVARNNVQRMMVGQKNLPQPAEEYIQRIKAQIPEKFGVLSDRFGSGLALATLSWRHIFLANLHERFTDQSLIVSRPYCYADFFA